MKAEFKGLVDLNAFEFVSVVPNGVNVVSARWVFAWKVDKDGNVVKPKARLVARGFSPVHTVDFLETYAPTRRRPVSNVWQLLLSRMTGNCGS